MTNKQPNSQCEDSFQNKKKQIYLEGEKKKKLVARSGEEKPNRLYQNMQQLRQMKKQLLWENDHQEIFTLEK